MKNVFGKARTPEEFAGNVLGETKTKVGNPRTKTKFSRSFSVPATIDDLISEIISDCEDKGIFGVNRSDVLVAAFSRLKFETEEEKLAVIDDIKNIKRS